MEAAHDGAVQGCNCIGGAKEDAPEIFHASEEFVNEGPLPASGGVFARREKESASSRRRMLLVSSFLCRTTKQYYSVSSQTTILSIRREDKITHYINYLFWTYLSTVVNLVKYSFGILYKKYRSWKKELTERKP